MAARCAPSWRTPAFVLTLLSSLPVRSEPPLTPGRGPEWGIAAGYGFSVHVNRGRSDEKVLLVVPSVGLRLGSRLEYLAEGHLAQYFSPRGGMIGLMPLGGRLFVGSGRTLATISIGMGLGWTDLTELEEIDRRFNFLLQGSVGVRRAISDEQAVTLEARLAHVSNAGTAPPNLGLNCLVFLAGWRFR